MLLTITYTLSGDSPSARDLSYLLHKNPARLQEFPLPMGKAYVFYPELSDEKTTAALLLDLDSPGISRGKPDARYRKFPDYVNDRPYAASSFLSSAISRVFGTAMSGRCEKRQELADSRLNLSACVYSLSVGEKKGILKEIFEPLGYRLSYECFPIDERFPEWGESSYVNLALKGHVRLAELLRHLYVLIPVFDRQKHYFISESEIDKLLLHGTGWLENHPARERIVRRYFARVQSYADIATQRLLKEGIREDIKGQQEEDRACAGDAFMPLDNIRLEAVCQEVIRCKASSVIDLGCGEGKLLELLIPIRELRKLCGMDVSKEALEKAGKRLLHKNYHVQERSRVELFQGSLMYKDSRICEFDAACVVEVIEHIAPEKRMIFEQVLFRNAAPSTVILTTPNREYNERYSGISRGMLRHVDHRFEWTREEFAVWTARICEQYGYEAEIKGIGEIDDRYGFPTQMGVFTKCR